MIIKKNNTVFIFVLLIIIFQSNLLFSQTYSKTIKWKNNRTVLIDDQNYLIFDFDHASLSNSGFLPHYSENIDFSLSFDPAYKYTIKPENMRFIALTGDEISNISGLDNIKNTVLYHSDIVFDRAKPYINIDMVPFRRNGSTGNIEKMISFDLQISKSKKDLKDHKKFNAPNSVLTSGTWKKIRINKSGIYMLTFQEIEAMGLSNPQNIRIFGNDVGWLPMIAGESRPDDLIENDILISGEAVYFFAHGPNLWQYNEVQGTFEPRHHYYSEYAYYFISTDYESAYDNQIKTINSVSLPETHTVNTYNYYQAHDVDKLNIAETGRIWYGESFEITNDQNFNFTALNLLDGSQASITVNAASTGGNSYFTVKVNGTSENITFSHPDSHSFADRSSVNFNFSAGSSDVIGVNLKYFKSSPAAQAWLDNIYINADCDLRFTSGQMMFRNADNTGVGNINLYTLTNAGSDVIVWDITDPTRPRSVNTDVFSDYQTFKLSNENVKQFIAFDNTVFLKPDLDNVIDVTNQNLHSTSGSTDMIIVTYPGFVNEAAELKSLHETRDGMNVILVTPEQIYNEFSCGAPDFSAIRDYARMVYQRASGDTLKYLLLFGDGSFDNRSGEGANGNFMITYQQKNSESIGYSYVTDDYFGLLDDTEGDLGSSITGLLDIGIGRIPVSSVKEAQDHVRKIKKYLNVSTLGDWRNQICFIADDEDYLVHMEDADELATNVEEKYPQFNIQKIYLDSYTQYTESGGERYPDVNNLINSTVQKGALLINYTGHGGEHGLAHERIVTISEIESWKNFERLPLFVTATCEFTRFDDYNFVSAGERVFLNPVGGAIAMFTTARIAYIHSNFLLSEQLYNCIFENDHKGNRLRLGDIIRKTKNNLSGNNKLIFFLMGDPALELGYAADNVVVTNTINGKPISEIDTLKALSEVTFNGEIQNNSGSLLSSFNGFVYPTIYDKSISVNTLDNDGIGAFTFKDRNNIVYKGKASVNDGQFTFTFIVPKDILMNVDSGKVSYYADNGNIDAGGYSHDFLVGDITDDYPEDNTGPEINLYMNDESFVSGGMTDPNPVILAKLFDEHGINTASGGIGHDITAVIDDDVQNVIIMNDEYRADADTYKSGKVEHLLFNLDPGEHIIKFKAWDVYNNSSEEFLDFVVIESENLTIDRLLNYPNPFTTYTEFWFEHNQIGSEIDVLIQIFTVSGKLVKTIESVIVPDGYRAGPFTWNGTDDFGNRIGRGVYVYRVKLRSSLGQTVEKFEKLLILK